MSTELTDLEYVMLLLLEMGAGRSSVSYGSLKESSEIPSRRTAQAIEEADVQGYLIDTGSSDDPNAWLLSRSGERFAQAVSDQVGREGFTLTDETPRTRQQPGGREVFIVHGHDQAAREATARFLVQLGLEPIVLQERAAGGRTLIEMIENDGGSASYAVVLLTPDDIGAAASQPETATARARENVMFELGFLMGHLGRNRTCVVRRGHVTMPSDLHGLRWIEMDNGEGWKFGLYRELKNAGLPVGSLA